mmetsp:Transcript_4796/g.19186  ORF Transcript_4796/g.19186 Transcript_4796/m.19186 type:complete len:253 (+) Transcript_4796:669-1427(+)
MPGRTRSALDASMTKCSKRERSAARAWAKFDACAARMEGPPRRTGRRVRVLTMAPDARSASAEMVLGPRAMIALRCTTTAQPGAKPSTLRTRSTAHASHAYTGTENTASAAAGVACPMVRESLRGSPLASGAEFFLELGRKQKGGVGRCGGADDAAAAVVCGRGERRGGGDADQQRNDDHAMSAAFDVRDGEVVVGGAGHVSLGFCRRVDVRGRRRRRRRQHAVVGGSTLPAAGVPPLADRSTRGEQRQAQR